MKTVSPTCTALINDQTREFYEKEGEEAKK
jgi:hypothetical protein